MESIETVLIEPIIAWKMWDWEESFNTLFSLFRREEWDAGEKFSAKCICPNYLNINEHKEPSPFEKCDCGIYSLKRPDFKTALIGKLMIFGRVALWGKVIEHEIGYRAQFAYPISFEAIFDSESRKLERIKRTDEKIIKLAAKYNVLINSSQEQIVFHNFCTQQAFISFELFKNQEERYNIIQLIWKKMEYALERDSREKNFEIEQFIEKTIEKDFNFFGERFRHVSKIRYKC